MPQDTSYANPTRSYHTMPPGALTFTVGRRDNDAYLAVIGALDIATHHALTQAATAVLHPPTRALVLDLHRVTFFGAAGVTALVNIRLAAANAGIRLALTGVRTNVQRVLDLTGTADLIPEARNHTIERLDDDMSLAPAIR